ncbi:DUF3307 domain-containing protein [uncultured Agrobacterium sp.]|uniref:DUF3307 domain-containing protein n=1 Tax=uncultured Agrobacterium sp. TaxID=157277 RepID=UPI0025CD31E5|nr:DUF3307 domain-containing protein [uncultured Agrobacterium sp.]
MIFTFTALLAAHLLADFILQTEWLVARKGKLKYLSLHVLLVAIAAALAIGAQTLVAAFAIGVIAVTHLALDYVKLHYLGNKLLAFALDQFGHLVVVLGIAFFIPTLMTKGWWAALPGDAQLAYYAGLTLVSGLIVAVPLGGILIKKLVEGLPSPPPPAQGVTASTSIVGMAKGGQYIGWLERGLTFLFVLTGRYEAVGFLLTAKSILRFGDIRDSNDRHIQEYIIIGTMLSFGWGFVAAVLTVKALAYWGLS